MRDVPREPLVESACTCWLPRRPTPPEPARFGIFSPAQYASEALTESPAEAYREAWLEAESRVSKLLERCGNMGEMVIPEGAAAPTLADLEELNKWLKGVWNTCLPAHEGEALIRRKSATWMPWRKPWANWSASMWTWPICCGRMACWR